MSLHDISLNAAQIAALYKQNLVLPSKEEPAAVGIKPAVSRPAPPNEVEEMTMIPSPNLASDKNLALPNETGTSKAAPASVSPLAPIPIFLGNNQSEVLIVVHYPECLHLPDDSLNFLLNILQACKKSLQEVCILNFASQSQELQALPTLLKTFHPTKLIGFGPQFLEKIKSSSSAQHIQLSSNEGMPSAQKPVSLLEWYAPPLQLNTQVILAPSLEEMNSAAPEVRALKGMLWNELKKMFQL